MCTNQPLVKAALLKPPLKSSLARSKLKVKLCWASLGLFLQHNGSLDRNGSLVPYTFTAPTEAPIGSASARTVIMIESFAATVLPFALTPSESLPPAVPVSTALLSLT